MKHKIRSEIKSRIKAYSELEKSKKSDIINAWPAEKMLGFIKK